MIIAADAAIDNSRLDLYEHRSSPVVASAPRSSLPGATGNLQHFKQVRTLRGQALRSPRCRSHRVNHRRRTDSRNPGALPRSFRERVGFFVPATEPEIREWRRLEAVPMVVRSLRERNLSRRSPA